MITNNKKKRQLLVAVLLVLGLVSITMGVTFAFFNYTRTGTGNVLAVGRINFNTSQGTSFNLSNVFPVKSTELENNSNVGSVTLTVTGDTTYDDGIEYLISADSVVNTVNSKKVPIGIRVTANNLGTSDNNYFGNRGGNTSIYKILAEDTINSDDRLVVGYITKGASGINGSVTVKAFIDADKIAITDTPGENIEWQRGREVFSTEEWNSLSSSGVSFKLKVEANEGIWLKDQIKYNANGGSVSPSYKEIENNITTYGALAVPTPPEGYEFDGWYTDPVNGTLVEASTVYVSGTSATTLYAHYNAVIPTISSCPGCKYLYYTSEETGLYTTWNTSGEQPSVLTTELSDNYLDVVEASGKDYFLGVETNSSNQVTNAYACGIKNDVPFCIEGTPDGANYTDNQTLLQGLDLWNNTCTVETSSTSCGPWDNSGVISADASSNGRVNVGLSHNIRIGMYHCMVNIAGFFGCY